MPLTYRAEGVARAPVETVWPLVATASRWTEWAGITSATLERTGTPDPDGVGAVRRFAVGPGASREEVLAWDPPHHLAYTILSGFPVRGYRADVELSPGPEPGTTRVIWHGACEPRWPGTGPLLAVGLRLLMARFVRRLCAHAGRVAQT